MPDESAPTKPPDDTADDGLQTLLPPELRKRWVVLPRFELAQMFFACLVFGAVLALGIAGWIYGIRWMYWSIPVGFTVLTVVNRVLRGKSRRYVEESRKYNPQPRS